MVVDIILRRVERTAVLLCLAMSFVAFVIPGGGGMTALAVLGGGLLVTVSYRMILSSAGVLAETSARAAAAKSALPADSGDARVTQAPARRTPLLAGVNVAGRYALLTVLAYVMIARLRLPPVGLLAGASSIVAAVSLEAVRFLWKKTP
ncbi:MAG: hypothetical protein V7647_4114 [Acidobacteriota bacterium]